MLKLSTEQQAIVNLPTNGDLLVKGIAGSGKTTVLVARAAKLIRESRGLFDDTETARARIFTYTRALTDYVRLLASQLDVEPPKVDSFHGWARDCLRGQLTGWSAVPDGQHEWLVAEALRRARQSARVRDSLFATPFPFWVDEFKWMQGRYLLVQENYVASTRTGRGGATRVTKEDKPFIFRAFTKYLELLQASRWYDWEGLATRVLDMRKVPLEQRSLHVLVDEAQDLTPADILAVRLSASRSITIAADKAQNIFGTRFAWDDIGLDVVGRSRTLKRSYRTTKPIADLARCLLRHDKVLAGELEQSPEYAFPNGPIPCVMTWSTRERELGVVRQAIKYFRNQQPHSVIGVLHRYRYKLEKLAEGLDAPVRKIWEPGNAFIREGVVLTTIHSAKGLEFDFVVVFGADKGVLPRAAAAEDKDDPDGEVALARRLLYVALTRARKGLIIVTGAQRERSPFFQELDHSLYEEWRVAA